MERKGDMVRQRLKTDLSLWLSLRIVIRNTGENEVAQFARIVLKQMDYSHLSSSKKFLEQAQGFFLSFFIDGSEFFNEAVFVYGADPVDDDPAFFALEGAGNSGGIFVPLGRHGDNDHGGKVIIHFVW